MSEVFVTSKVEMFERQIADKQKLIEMRNTAQRLAEHPDFKKLILTEFCLNESARYAHASGDPALDAQQRADALSIAQAGGRLKHWLSIQIMMGNTAEDEIQNYREALDEIRAEEAEDVIERTRIDASEDRATSVDLADPGAL